MALDSVQQRKRAADANALSDEEADVEALLGRVDDEPREHKAHGAPRRALSLGALWRWLLAAWLLLALLWVRWPVYFRTLHAALQDALPGGKQEVEPVVVTLALALPFCLAGLLFYATAGAGGTAQGADAARRRRNRAADGSAVARLAAAPYRAVRTLLPTADVADVVAVACFLALQLNLVVGKLLIDHENGKLAKSGVADRLARALGMNALYAMVLSVLLLARRSFVHELLHLSAERATRYHVWSGQFGGVMLILHGVGYILVWLRDDKLYKMLVPCLDPETCTTKQQYGTTRNFFGLLAFLVWIVVALGSLANVRRSNFRLFTLLHCLLVPFLVLAGFHYYPLVFWIAPAIVVYLIYRVASLYSRGEANVLSVTSLSDKVLRLELDVGGQNAVPYAPGQYVYIQVPSIAKREWHPFSISAGSRRGSDNDAQRALWLDIRVQRGFTKRLLHLARSNQLSSVCIDGYYGTPITVSPHMVFVAGGSGMAPFLSVLEHIKHAAELRDNAYSNAIGDELSQLPQSIWVIWTSRGAELLDAHCELLDAIRKSPRWKGKIWLHMTTLGEKRGLPDLDDDDMTEPDDIDSDALTPRIERFRPVMAIRNAGSAFSGRFGELVGLHLFVGAVLGCLLSMATVYFNSSVWYVKRPLLMAAAIIGAAVGAAAGVLFRQMQSRSRSMGGAYSSINGSNHTTDLPIAATELDFDASRPMTPSTPRSFRDATPSSTSSSPLARLFTVEHGRPDLQVLLKTVHGEIQENYGMSARASVFVSGPAELQSHALSIARAFRAPSFAVHEKSFEL